MQVDLDSFDNRFNLSEMFRNMLRLARKQEYVKGLQELIKDIKSYGLKMGFEMDIDLVPLKNLPADERELGLCKKTLWSHYTEICSKYQGDILNPKIIRNRSIYFKNFEQVCKKVLCQNSFNNITFSDAGLFYAFTLVQLLEGLGENVFEQNEVENVHTAGNFQLIYKGSISKCYDMLKNHQFISRDTTKVMFSQIFKRNSNTNKVNWTGTNSELAWFIFFLHNDLKYKGHVAVCSDTDKKRQKAANYFVDLTEAI